MPKAVAEALEVPERSAQPLSETLAEILRDWENQNIPMIMGTVLFASLLIVVANLVIDLLYSLLDPRITYG